ncbi:Capsular polysaccharide biosynthesis protein [Lachnospiraceae bacterium NE2001]|nr:Capsular polysaccharide biosynthesis protein [Lachnospiraceae bacterium NE2001]
MNNNTPNNNNVVEIDLLELIKVLWSKIWLIILVSVFGLGLAAGYTMLFMKPVYKSTSIMYVLTKSTSITSLADIQMGTQLTQDYIVVIKSRPVVETVIENLGLDMTFEQLRDNISVNNPTNTRFLEITVSNHDAFLAKKIVDELANVSAESMADVMDTQAPNIMDYGQIPDHPSEPSLTKNAIIGAMIGFVIICGIITVMYILNDSIKTPDDIEKYLGLNTLGLIPLEEGTSKRRSHGRDSSARRSRHKKKTDNAA